ncbi:MAG TPA: PD-(D/E)XK nuclease family protein [Thermoanaerobaculia bacterium]|nr:PD-(D/E)XK nuclease family protein [Thermoanaerobaculia bacterium]
MSISIGASFFERVPEYHVSRFKDSPLPTLLEQLSTLCTDNRTGEKIVIAPSLAIGHQIGDALAHRGTSWVNLRFESIRTLVDAVIGFDLASEGVTVLSRAQALALIEKACDRALPEDSYFASLADRPGLHRAVQRSVDDLRLAGVLLSTVASTAFEDPRKARDLGAIVDAYEDELTRGRFVDRPGVLARAIQKLERSDKRPWRGDSVWRLLEDVDLSSQEERFLELATEGKLVRLESAPPVDSNPRPGVGNSATRSPTLRLKEQGVLPFLLTPSTSLPAVPVDPTPPAPPVKGLSSPEQVASLGPEAASAQFEFVRAIGEENELRAAFRSILAQNGRFDSAEVVYTNRQSYLPLAYELTSELAIPTTFAEGIAAAYTRPGQACLAFLRWVGEGWEASTLQRAAKTGVINLRSDDRDDLPMSLPMSPSSFARIVRDAKIGWGRERYLPRIQAWIREQSTIEVEADEAKRASHERNAARGRAVEAILEQLLKISRDVAEGDRIDMGALARSTSQFVSELAAVRSEIDGMAQMGLRRMLDELASLPSALIRRTDATERLREAVTSLHVAASNPRPGHLHFAPVRAGGWSGRPLSWIVGLDDAKYPGSGLQDPVLLDSERGAINETIGPRRRLPLRGEAPARTSQQLIHLIRRVDSGTRVVLSFSSLELGERRELYPANAILEVFRWSRSQGDASYADVLDSIPHPAGFIDEKTALTGSEWWLGRKFSRTDLVGPTAVRAAYPWLESAFEAITARASDALTKWDGMISAPPEQIDPRFNGRVYSASQLEKMARCPIGHFFERILFIEPVEELERDPDLWLNPMEAGSLFHEVMETFMKQLCGTGERPTAASHRQKLHAVAEDAVARWRELVPPPNETAFQTRKDELLESCDVFLTVEEVDCSEVTPKYFEVGFGLGRDESADIAMADPFVLDLGGGRVVKLRGQIDRVDFHDASGQWDVWDYKSGSTFGYEGNGRLARGTKIQHALYARALCAMLKKTDAQARVRQSGYYFPTRKGRGLRLQRECGDGELEHALNLLFDTIGRGFFPHPRVDACKFCDYKTVSGDPAAAAHDMERKLIANPDHPAVIAWQKLQDVP